MGMERYQKAKQINMAAKFGEVVLIVLLIWKISRESTADDLSFLTAMFLMAIIVIVANVIAVIAEKKALKEITEALGHVAS